MHETYMSPLSAVCLSLTYPPATEVIVNNLCYVIYCNLSIRLSVIVNGVSVCPL